MATTHEKNPISRISIKPISNVVQKIASWVQKPPNSGGSMATIYSDEEYYRDMQRKKVQQRIEKAKYSVYSHRGM